MAGRYGSEYDRYATSNHDQSAIFKMKESYWMTKQAVMTKLGKKQDEHIVSSDSELDAKLEVFKAIQQSSIDLLRVIERYQDRICILSREENTMGRLLKAESTHDKTRAGKMMAAVGKAQCYSSQQMLGLRAPLVRLYQEVETFRYRAIADTLVTVNRMEASRTEYRGALMWMKDVSEELDPDTSKQLQKFRTVQAQVKKNKAKFDRLKLDTMQKIDLLAASRCNMFSQVLAKYQTTLLQFWEKTSTRMSAVAQSFKGYQYYEFNMLKELGEPSKRLADETGAQESTGEHDDDDEGSGLAAPASSNKPSKPSSSSAPSRSKNSANDTSKKGSLNNLLDSIDREFDNNAVGGVRPKNSTGGSHGVGGDGKGASSPPEEGPSGCSSPPFIDFADDEDVDFDEMLRKQDEEFNLTGIMKQSKGTAAGASEKQTKPASGGTGASVDLLGEDLQQDDLGKDDMTLLNEILSGGGGGSGGVADFSQEWTAVFGNTSGGGAALPGQAFVAGAESDLSSDGGFMPSCLLDMTSGGPGGVFGGGAPPLASRIMGNQSILTPSGMSQPLPTDTKANTTARAAPSNTGPKPKKKGQKQEMSAWFSLFAELDPLANPDAIGRNKDDITDA